MLALLIVVVVDVFTGPIKAEPAAIARACGVWRRAGQRNREVALRSGRRQKATGACPQSTGAAVLHAKTRERAEVQRENLRTVVARCRRGHGPGMRAQEAADA
jgi:hypothetical protein